MSGSVDFDLGFSKLGLFMLGLLAKGSARYGEHLKFCFQGHSLRSCDAAIGGSIRVGEECMEIELSSKITGRFH